MSSPNANANANALNQIELNKEPNAVRIIVVTMPKAVQIIVSKSVGAA
jgi:hypothetical protein